MNFKLKKPCSNCPFLREGGIRLRPLRAREIADSQLSGQGGSFACHKTVDYEEDGASMGSYHENYCGGALIFAEKNRAMNQILRIMCRIGAYNPDGLDKDSFDKVFDSKAEMVRANKERTKHESSRS